MFNEYLGVTLIFLSAVLLAIPLGRYMALVYNGQPTWLDFLQPIERWFYKIAGIDASQHMRWQQHAKALLVINLVWFAIGYLLLLCQQWLPLNPDGNANQSADLAFNTIISFVVNCNLQHYSGETGLTYFTQHFVVMFLQFVSAGAGMATGVVVLNALRQHSGQQLGNFWHLFTLSVTRILLPLSIVLAIALALNGVPTSYDGKAQFTTLQGDTVQVSRGPAAAMIAIKQLGTNGGGWFGANSAHPFENPNYFTNALENIAILLIPIGFIFFLGYYLQRQRLAWSIFGVMTVGFLLLLLPSVIAETSGNAALDTLGISQANGSMEGKEVRFGAAASAMWGISTTATSNGSVNAMHDSMTPVSGAMQLLDMMINAFYGGVGVGWLNYFVLLVIAVFVAGLMVGRTPELLGRKIEAREIKIASLIAILHPLLILAGTALATHILVHQPQAHWAVPPGAWLNNPGFHGFSEMLYEYTSAAANNGSGFEGLADNNPFWNISTGIVLLLSRFLPMIGPLAIAGMLAQKQPVPDSAGTLHVHTVTFACTTLAIIIILAALSFFPALALGPLAEAFAR